jgi:hypothetical protein
MAKEIELDIKVNGIASIKKELRDLKGELINATDPAEIERLSKAAGELTDRIGDANAQIKAFASGSKFETVANGLGLVGDNLKNLDFAEASKNAALLTGTIKSMNPKDVAQGFKDFTKTIGQLGNAFLQMGIKLLANPLFLLVAVIIGVVVAIVMLKDKLKIAEQAFDLIMKPIKVLIQGLKDLTDWLGLTAFAEEEAAQKSIDAANKRIAANEKVTNSVDKEYSRQIALAKANGEDTTKLEVEQAKAQQAAASKNIDDRRKIADAKKVLLDNAVGENKKAAQEEFNDSKDALDEEVQKYKDAKNAKAVIQATSSTKAREDATKANQKSIDDQAKANKAAEDAAKRHLAIIRGLRDLELANMKEGLQKDLALNQEKYNRDLENLKTNKDMTQQERDKYGVEYLKRKENDDKKAYDSEKKRLADVAQLQKDAREKELADLEANRVALINYNNNYADYILEKTGTDLDKRKAIIKKDMDDAIGNENSRFFAELNNLKLTQFEKENLEREHQKRLRKIKGIAADETTKADEESKGIEIAATIDKYTKIAEQAMVGVNAINGFLNQSDTNRLNEVKGKQEAEINSLTEKQNKELSVTGLSENQKQAINDKYAKLKYAADLKAFNESETIKKKQFAREKALRMVSVVIDTAKAISGSIAASPLTFGAPWSIVNGAIGAIQLATIASQKYQGEAGPSAPSIGGTGGGGGSSTPVTPSFSLTGQANAGSTGEASQSRIARENQQISVVAVVSETEITNVQNRANRIRQSAEI